MSSTSGVITTAIGAVLCSQIILTTWLFWLARRVARLSHLASRVTKRAQAPEQWESRLVEVAADVSSLSLSTEKALRQLTRLNSRAGMRELRAKDDKGSAPPVGAGKQALRAHYGVGGVSGRQMQEKMRLVQNNSEESN